MHSDVLFYCGHELTVRFFGNIMEVMAQEHAIIARKCVCQECALEEFGGLPKCTEKDLTDDSRELRLPEINGSWKQVRWAMTMRHQMLALPFGAIWRLLCLEANILRSLPDYGRVMGDSFMADRRPVSDEQDAVCADWYDAICRQTEAASWIANRNNYGFGICNAVIWGRYGGKVEALRGERRRKHKELLDAMEKAETERTEQTLREAEKAFDEWDRARKQAAPRVDTWDKPLLNAADEDEEDYWDLEREFEKLP